jgi:hypothetical protein
MLKLWKILALALMSVFALQYCTHKDEIETITPVEKDYNCDPNTVYYVNQIQPLLNSSCAYSGCHDAITHKDGVDLSTYDKVMNTGEVEAGNPKDSELYEEIEEGEMPPNGSMALTQQQLIYKWILQGAKNNECVSPCDTSNVTFAQTIKPILDNNCVGCHGGTAPQGGISLHNYSAVRVEALNGRLLGSVNHQTGYYPMPKDAAKLSDCNINQIKIWIDEGIQNN